MRKLLSISGFFGLVFALCSITHGNQQARPNYYPLKEGSKWHYRVDVTGKASEKATMHAAKLEKIDNVDLFRLESILGGQVVATEHLTSDERGVFRHRVMGQPISKPVCLVKYPVTHGEKWRDEVEMGGTKLVMQIQVGKEEEVQVPAGKFQCIPVQVETEVAGTKLETTYWFAVDVGIVKQFIDVGGTTFTMFLEKYEPAR